MNYLRLAIAAGMAVLLIACAALFHAWRDEAETFASFRGAVEAAGRAQNERTAERVKGDKARKEASDASYQVALTALGNDLGRLLNTPRPGIRVLPPSPAGSRCPDGQRCFDRGEFDSALREHQEREESIDEDAARLIGEGATLKLRLDTAVRWASEALR